MEQIPEQTKSAMESKIKEIIADIIVKRICVNFSTVYNDTLVTKRLNKHLSNMCSPVQHSGVSGMLPIYISTNEQSSVRIQETFAGFIIYTPEADKTRRTSTLLELNKFWQTCPAVMQESCMKSLVVTLHNQTSISLIQTLSSALKSLVDQNLVSAKLVCDVLLTSEKMNYNNPDIWCQTLKLIRQIIGGIDYKGCRDLLRAILERTLNLPPVDNVAASRLLDAVDEVVLDNIYTTNSSVEVVRYILNRNACLLPSYFAVNEVTKLFAEDRSNPHWKFSQMLSDFVQSFRPAAQMVTVCGRSKLLPIVSHSSSASNVWRLNTSSLRFTLNGPLPYDKELCEPQSDLLSYVLEQPYSRDMVCSMLNLNKQIKSRCLVLEEQLVKLVIVAMERTEDEELTNEEESASLHLWQHLSSQVIFFVLFQFASFPHMVMVLNDQLKIRKLRKGRDYLMWILLQFISGSIQKNPLEDFLPVMRLYDLLYPEMEENPVPDITKAFCTYKMAATCIWIHLTKKAQGDKVALQRPIPVALAGHVECLQQILNLKTINLSDYKIVLLCNAYSTNSDYFAQPMSILVETIYGVPQKTTQLPGNVTASAPTQPLSMNMLDSLTVHAKMSLIHSIVTRVIRLAQQKPGVALSPSLVETYSRLLVYIEIESLGIKGFISQLLPSVFKATSWGILHTLLEMFSYRLHHIQPHYRIQLLSQLHTVTQVPQTNLYQLHLCVESTALHLIMGLGSWEVQPQLSRMFSEPKTISLLSNESEELNRAMVLTLARAMHVTGSESLTSTWCKDILTTIMQNTPHSWSTHTLLCFPPALSEFFQHSNVLREDKGALKRNVETEYRKWKSMASENDLIAHFSTSGSPPLFICVLWKSLQEDNRIAPMAYKVLDRLGPRALASQLRTFADYLVFEISTSGAGNQVNKYVESINDLIWKCCIVPLDRLILCMSLRSFEGNDAQVCFYVIQVLLLRTSEFRNRVTEFVKENSPEHWSQNNWHERHMAFHKKYPEKFYFESLPEVAQLPQNQYLPIYFGNICLRFLPVFDILIHRFLELPQVTKSLENLLEHLGILYKFHDRPLTYLYSTLHYYEKKLRERPNLKKKLVHAIIGSLKDIKQPNWCLTDSYLQYLQRPMDDTTWEPEQEYYIKIVGRMVETIAGKPAFPPSDWRFNEFPNPAAHALHATTIELMALPVPSHVVGRALFDIVLKGIVQIPRDKIVSWMNAIGIIITAMPEGYWVMLNDCIREAITDPHLSSPTPDCNPFQMFNFTNSHQVAGEVGYSYVLALCHAVWEHASIGQLSQVTQFMREKLKPVLKSEHQFLFVCHLVGPFLQRFHTERTRCLLELTVELYEMLEAVDHAVDHIQYMDPISDFLYHVKYMFVGDGVKNEVEKVIRGLRPALQMRLRFISHHSKDESTPVVVSQQ